MMSTRARNAVVAALVLLLGGLAAYAVLVGKPEPLPEVAPEPQAPLVDVVIATPREQALTVRTQGTVRPLREVKLVSRVNGRVERVSPRFAVGGFFAANQELVKVEDVDYRLAIARAESQVAAAKQRLAEERGRSRQAEREWRDLGTSEANALFLRKPQIAAAEAALRASEADL
ncbi:MAG: efflux transporter periplasmic adaptor subunit, partial [Halioglobus sp.]|nr:efflux transporter periplasmic adaptor subunit [Halioglobus sp.]